MSFFMVIYLIYLITKSCANP